MIDGSSVIHPPAVYNKFTFTNNDQNKQLKIVLEKFDSYFEPKKLVKSHITRFQQRVQEPQETVAEYISALREPHIVNLVR